MAASLPVAALSFMRRPDRRQLPDRRKAWRGGRRAADSAEGVGDVLDREHEAPRPARELASARRQPSLVIGRT